MNKNFEIIDWTGTVESGLSDLDDAQVRLQELLDEGFDFVGNVRIVEVHYTVQ